MQVNFYFIEFLKPDLSGVGGGGIGTLIMHLIPVVQECGHEVTVYQCASKRFEGQYNGARVVGIPIHPGPGWPNEKVVSVLRNEARACEKQGDLIELFAADFFSVANQNPLAITVQNGLAWDAKIDLLTRKPYFQKGFGELLFRLRRQQMGLRHFEYSFNRIAVDLYFLNWYRSFRGPNYPGRVFYNPNPAPEAAWDTARDLPKDPSLPVRLVMARRLVPEKGTRLAAVAFKRLLELRPHVTITFAGEGADKVFLEQAFSGDGRVDFKVYHPENVVAFHRQYDIAVIPSVCGEATCLAVSEAMAAGCAVMATNMGGTITQILDGYNGILCWPEEENILNGLLRLVDDSTERNMMARRGWESSQTTFCMKGWQARWKAILEEVVQGKKEALAAMRREG